MSPEQVAVSSILVTVVVGPLIALIVWVVKKIVPAVIRNMDANTEAQQANAKAVGLVGSTLEKFITVQHERDVRLFLQLDRIEANTRHDVLRSKSTS